MATFDELAQFNDALIRKALQASIWVAPMSVADEITQIKDATGVLVPTGYEPVGRISTDGVSIPRDVTTSDTESLGAAQPTRRDITSDVSSVSFTMQETKETTLSLYEGQDLSATTYDADGNLFWDRPDRPASTHHRVLVLMKDGDGAEAQYRALWLPRAQVTDRGEVTLSAESEVSYNVTFTAFVDATFGTALRSLIAGPTTALDAMGFTAALP